MTTAAAPPSLPFPPGTFPPGVDPETYKIEEVTRLLKSAAYFPVFSAPNPDAPNEMISAPGKPLVAVRVNEDLHRFEIDVKQPDCQNGVRSSNTVGQVAANVSIRWTVMPWEFEAAPDRMPPPTQLNPLVSQRFCMLDGALHFKDKDKSGFHAFGAGRTFPVLANWEPRLRIGAVIDVLEGLGKFHGLQGTVVVNGFIQPPSNLALNIMIRMMDPDNRLLANSPTQALEPIPDPDPDATFLIFLGEVDPDNPVKLITDKSGKPIGSEVHELLRLVHIGWDLDTPADLRSRYETGPIVGRVSARLWFDPLNPAPIGPIQTTDGVFTFYGAKGQTIGQIRSNMVEGRAFRTPLKGAPIPVFRFGGFGPIIDGSGQFSHASGMMSMNSAISVFPRTLSNLYILRAFNPGGLLNAKICREWASMY